MRRLRIRRPRKATPNLSATFHAGGNAGGLGMRGGGNVTFDAALDLIDGEQQRRDRAKARRAENSGQTLKRTFAVANAIQASGRSKAKVKMPTFSIQKDKEIGDA